MDLVSISAGIVVLLVGAAFCFGGFRFFRWLLPIFGFLVGFWIGEGIIAALFDYTTTMVIIGWIVGLIVGLVLAGLSYFLFKAGIVILGALFGYWLTTAVVSAIGLNSALLVLFLGIAGAILFALLTMRASLQVYLVVIITAVFGSIMFLTGLALIINILSLDEFRANTFVMRNIIGTSPLWLLLWIILFLIGFIWQYRSARGAVLEQW